MHFVRHGFLGLANNWIETVTEEDTRGMSSHASSPIGSSRFEDFKEERVQQAAMRQSSTLSGRRAVVVLGGDGSLRGARAIYEGFGVQVVGIPGTIDNNIEGTISLGFHSAVALAEPSIESLKATSAAMGSVFFVEVMGAGSGHLALAAPIRRGRKDCWSTSIRIRMPISTTSSSARLKRTLGVPNKSHLFVVAERTPHRHHHREGGVHGLVDYVAGVIAQWPQRQARTRALSADAGDESHHSRPYAAGRAARRPKTRRSRSIWPMRPFARLIEQPETIVGCMVAYRDSPR